MYSKAPETNNKGLAIHIFVYICWYSLLRILLSLFILTEFCLRLTYFLLKGKIFFSCMGNNHKVPPSITTNWPPSDRYLQPTGNMHFWMFLPTLWFGESQVVQNPTQLMSFNNSFKPDFLAETTAMLSMQLSVYSQNTHTISKIKEEENMDFFYNCIGLNATVWPVSTQTDIGTKQTGLESFKLSCFYPIDKSPVSDHWPIMVPHFSTSESTGRNNKNQRKRHH